MRVGLLAYAILFTPAPGSLLLFYCAVVSEWLLPFEGLPDQDVSDSNSDNLQ